jgi:hypothetical protein
MPFSRDISLLLLSRSVAQLNAGLLLSQPKLRASLKDLENSEA